tara:strand:+ start:660 stop:776 length:117 start_codon:yes stop_codon:yes gene_type:complete
MIELFLGLLFPIATIFFVIGMASLDEKVGEWEEKRWNS